MSPMLLNKNEGEYLLSLARRNLEHFLREHEKIFVDPSELPSEKLLEKLGTFVTLMENSQLRGCIGHILPVQELYLDIIDNSISAAIHDPRFSPVSLKELPSIHIEISVLSLPEALAYSDSKDLIAKIVPGKMGLVLKKGYNEATFLPQVWEQLPDTESFLSHLCSKAGLLQDAWKDGDLEVEAYTVQKFEERS